MSRDLMAAAAHLLGSTGDQLEIIAKHDPDMIRDVAAAMFASAPPPSRGPSREEVARIISHHVQIEASYDAVGRQYQRVTNADQLADAIIALFSTGEP